MALMGRMGRGERDGQPETGEAARVRTTRSEAPAPRTVAPATSVDAGTELEGRLRCRETLRIDGQVKGEVECDKLVLVGEGARIQAHIAADEVQIAGAVQGNVTARRKITLGRTAVVTGDLSTPGIVIEEGAKLKGQIVIGADPEPAAEAAKVAEAEKAPRKKKTTAAKEPSAPAPMPATA